MKLAEALVQRKALQQRISQAEEAITLSAVSSEGWDPDEDPKAIEQDLARLHQEFEELVVRIHRTNISARLESGKTLTEAIAHRDTLAKQHRFAKTLLETVLKRNQPQDWEREKQRKIAVLPVKDLRRNHDELGKDLRLLDTTLQQANWTVDVLD
jgi:hypothetical protein